MRFRYGAGRLIGRFRREAMFGVRGKKIWVQCLYLNGPAILDGNRPVPSATYILFRNAILAEQQVVCSYDGRLREPARTSSAPTRMAKRSSLPGSSPARALAGCRNGAAC